MNKYDFLDSERTKLWDRIIHLEEVINKKTSDYEKEAQQASRKASEYRNKSNEAKELAISSAVQAHEKAEEAKLCLTHIKTLKTRSEEHSRKIDEFVADLDERKEIIEESLETLEENFGKNAIFIENLETLNNHFIQGEETIGKIDTLHKSLQPKKTQIDNLYREIFGYTETGTDEEGKPTSIKIEGLKDQLDETYDELVDNLEDLQKEVETTKSETIEKYNTFISEKENHYNTKLESWNKEHLLVLEKINKLLPNALTTGLSYAYSEKKESEINDSTKFARTFRQAALGLATMSLIPFGLSIFFIFEGKTLMNVIEYSPRFVLAIIPMYIPILWIAYSSNKKLNLSKRLIEEYTHKEVLSKTFEGLSYQINKIEDEDVSADLKIKLLYNILSVSSENPGKLISDYNKSDHPLMDALDKSASLSDAVEKLENIPGLSKIARILDKRAKRILKEQSDKIDSTLGEVVEATLNVIPEE